MSTPNSWSGPPISNGAISTTGNLIVLRVLYSKTVLPHSPVCFCEVKRKKMLDMSAASVEIIPQFIRFQTSYFCNSKPSQPVSNCRCCGNVPRREQLWPEFVFSIFYWKGCRCCQSSMLRDVPAPLQYFLLHWQGGGMQCWICKVTVIAPSPNHSPWLQPAGLGLLWRVLELTWDGSKLGESDFPDFDSKARRYL